jgi:DNA-binding beta-propeller fold protein YncE
MIKKCDSLLVAERLLALVILKERNIDYNEENTLYVECYQNGREQGYMITLPNCKAIYFSENRNSDSVVVYYGQNSCQGIDEDTYASAKYFDSDKDYEAADYIILLIKETYKTNKREEK